MAARSPPWSDPAKVQLWRSTAMPRSARSAALFDSTGGRRQGQEAAERAPALEAVIDGFGGLARPYEARPGPLRKPGAHAIACSQSRLRSRYGHTILFGPKKIAVKISNPLTAARCHIQVPNRGLKSGGNTVVKEMGIPLDDISR